MNTETYSRMANLISQIPPKESTPKGQKFHIGDIVKITRPKSWFSKRSVEENKERLYQIRYSYTQKFGGSMEHHNNSYSLKHLFEDNSSSWYDADELELVKSIDKINEEKDLV